MKRSLLGSSIRSRRPSPQTGKAFGVEEFSEVPVVPRLVKYRVQSENLFPAYSPTHRVMFVHRSALSVKLETLGK
jgi:hypothetical protein